MANGFLIRKMFNAINLHENACKIKMKYYLLLNNNGHKTPTAWYNKQWARTWREELRYHGYQWKWAHMLWKTCYGGAWKTKNRELSIQKNRNENLQISALPSHCNLMHNNQTTETVSTDRQRLLANLVYADTRKSHPYPLWSTHTWRASRQQSKPAMVRQILRDSNECSVTLGKTGTRPVPR